MFGKLFESMYRGTLASKGPWQALVTFQQMIILAKRDGVVDETADSISRQTTIPLEIITIGLKALQEPDSESRIDLEGGRRVVLLDPPRPWGWRIVNYEYYRNLRSREDRNEYMRVYMQERRAATNNVNLLAPPLTAVSNVRPGRGIGISKETPAPSVLVDPASLNPPGTEENQEKPEGKKPYRCPPCPTSVILDLYHEHLPTLPRVEVLNDVRKRATAARWREVCVDGKLTRDAGVDWFAWFFKERVKTSKFLLGQIPGKSGKTWVCDFDFLMTASKFAKVIEGFYHRDQR